MDGSRFDNLVKSLGAGRSRRSVLGALAGAALAAVGVGSAEAANKRSVGNACSTNSDCASGLCVQETRTRKICHCRSAGDCPAATAQCQTAACLPTGYCGAAITAGASCDDGVPCTVNDVCQADGSCVGTPKSCDDNNACTADACDPVTGNCINSPVVCDDGNLCTIDSCNPATGCVYTPVICAPSNDCHAVGPCDPASGCPPETYNGDGTPCAIGVCHGGACCAPEDPSVTCAGGKCGAHTNNCGQSVDCGGCASGQVCASDGSMCKSTNPAPTCAGQNAFCADIPACGSNQLGACACVPTVEGGGICEGGSIAYGACETSADCPGAQLCVDMTCDGLGKFCMGYNDCSAV